MVPIGDSSPSDTLELSVIIPVYNQEVWLDTSLSSLSAQNITSAEFLIINDGSTDRSTDIIAEYLVSDSRFRLISRENGGYGAALNTGLDAARGKWIGIMEPDDECEEHMFSILMEYASRGGCDVVKAGFSEIDKTGRITCRGNALFRPTDDGGVFGPGDAPDLFVIHQSPWSAIYKRDFLRRNAIRCPETRGGYQDAGFTFAIWLANPLIRWVDRPLYRYRRYHDGNSIGDDGRVKAAVDVLGYLVNLIQSDSNINRYNIDIIAPAIRGIIAIMTWHGLRLDKKQLRFYLGELDSLISILCESNIEAWAAASELLRSDRLRYIFFRAMQSGNKQTVHKSILLLKRRNKLAHRLIQLRFRLRRLRHYLLIKFRSK